MKLGEKLSPILSEIEDTLLENYETKPCYTEDGFIAGAYIFQSVLMDKMWELQELEKISMETRCDMATKCGSAIRELIKTFTNLDMHVLVKERSDRLHTF